MIGATEKPPRLVVLEHPDNERALEAIKDAISKKRTLIVAGRCRVNYEGRASSKLEEGERIVLIKPDGSAQVHRTRDHAPVNWQPPGSLFRTRLNEGELILRAFRRKENEVLEVIFKEILLIVSLDLIDTATFYLYASEEDMQKAILLRPSLLEEGFKPITSERPVEPGFIDILGRDKFGVLTVVEIKRNPATKEAVLQLNRYIQAFVKDERSKVRGILVAPGLAKGAQEALAALGLEVKLLSPQVCAETLSRRKKTGQLLDFIDDGEKV